MANSGYTARLNFSLSRIAFSDSGVITNNPTLRSYDWVTQGQGLCVRDTHSLDTTVQPGQSVLLKSTERTVTADGTTSMSVSHAIFANDVMMYRYTGTGAAPGFRTNRAIGGDATTIISVSLLGTTAAVFTQSGGTAMDFSSVIIGDNVFLQPTNDTVTSPFNVSSTGLYPGSLLTVIDKNSTSITVKNPGTLVTETITLGANFSDSFRVFSGSGVQINDSVSFDPTCALNIQNKSGHLDVQMVTDRDLYILNTSGVDQFAVALGGVIVPPIRVFSDIISFIVVDADGALTLRLNNNATGDITMYTYAQNRSFFAGSLNATSIMAINNTTCPINARINTASF
jgi:hypothetical protein